MCKLALSRSSGEVVIWGWRGEGIYMVIMSEIISIETPAEIRTPRSTHGAWQGELSEMNIEFRLRMLLYRAQESGCVAARQCVQRGGCTEEADVTLAVRASSSPYAAARARA